MISKKYFFDLAKQAAGEKGLKFLASSWDVYCYDEDFMWKIHLLPDTLPNARRITALLYCGTPQFDDLLASITKPGEPVKITKGQHISGIYIGPNTLLNKKIYPLSQTDYDLPTIESGNGTELERTLRQIIEEAIALASAKCLCVQQEFGTLVDYYLSTKDEEPMTCGLAYMCKGEWQKACECFAYTESAGKGWNVSYSSSRNLQDAVLNAKSLCRVLWDYCLCKDGGIAWKKEYVYGPLPANPAASALPGRRSALH